MVPWISGRPGEVPAYSGRDFVNQRIAEYDRRIEQIALKSADGRMATEAARLKGKIPEREKKQTQLDSNRPSHGRTWPQRPRIPVDALVANSLCRRQERRTTR